jgi:hypothetical protein
MPQLVDALAHISSSLRAIGAALQASNAQPAVPDAAPPPPDTQAQPVASEALQAHTDVMTTLAQIAQKHLGIVTLEVRNRDRLDFHEVSVLSVADALGRPERAQVPCWRIRTRSKRPFARSVSSPQT